MRHPGLIDVLVTELRTLGADAAALLQAQRDYVTEWVGLIRAARPTLSETEAQATAQTALMVVNDVARAPSLTCVPGIGEVLADLAVAALRV